MQHRGWTSRISFGGCERRPNHHRILAIPPRGESIQCIRLFRPTFSEICQPLSESSGCCSALAGACERGSAKRELSRKSKKKTTTTRTATKKKRKNRPRAFRHIQHIQHTQYIQYTRRARLVWLLQHCSGCRAVPVFAAPLQHQLQHQHQQLDDSSVDWLGK